MNCKTHRCRHKTVSDPDGWWGRNFGMTQHPNFKYFYCQAHVVEEQEFHELLHGALRESDVLYLAQHPELWEETRQ